MIGNPRAMLLPRRYELFGRAILLIVAVKAYQIYGNHKSSDVDLANYLVWFQDGKSYSEPGILGGDDTSGGDRLFNDTYCILLHE